MRQFISAITIRYYVDRHGRAPFETWLEGIADRQARARIKIRLDRLARGLFGDTKALGGGIEELRIHHGPGYRIYYGRIGGLVVLLLCGGTKDRQRKDIARARAYWVDYLEATHGKDKTKTEQGL